MDARKLLIPFGSVYGLAANARNAMYDRGFLAAHDLGARTVSVGNITAGGTGKTPLVALIAEMLAEAGEQVCILTRGYGRRDPGERVLVSDGENFLADAATGGDEPADLARRLIGKAAIVADADRVSAAKWARERFGVTVFLLDDGFQHRRAKRDVDVICIDATDPFGGERMLPAGRLREPLENLRRADAVVVTRADLVVSTAEIAARVRTINEAARIFETACTGCNITELSEFIKGGAAEPATQGLVTMPLAFCGIGNPRAFFEQLKRERLRVAAEHRFRDHHRYTQGDIDRLEQAAAAAGAECFVTTSKDAVKLATLTFSMRCFVVDPVMTISDEGRFRSLVTAAASS
jgi:tetraacyldisaccharide 4'-kinase